MFSVFSTSMRTTFAQIVTPTKPMNTSAVYKVQNNPDMSQILTLFGKCALFGRKVHNPTASKYFTIWSNWLSHFTFLHLNGLGHCEWIILWSYLWFILKVKVEKRIKSNVFQDPSSTPIPPNEMVKRSPMVLGGSLSHTYSPKYNFSIKISQGHRRHFYTLQCPIYRRYRRG